MKPIELAQQCVRSVEFCNEAGIPADEAGITVVLPKGWKPPPRFPRRTLLTVNPRGERVYRLPALKVLAWLAGNGLVGVEYGMSSDAKPAKT